MLPRVFNREDESSDAHFYSEPRLVTHIDDGAIAAVTQLYREYLPAGGAILDLMSSWISHLPEDVQYRHVTGLGMNRAELEQNPRLHRAVVHDLNQSPALPFSADEFDAAVICVSIDYLIRPVEVLRELSRVVRSGGPLVITFSNRCFPTKVISPWLALDDAGRVALVARMLHESTMWDKITTIDRSPARGDPLFAVVAQNRDLSSV